MKTIVLTGGGTAGHVTPHLALIPKLKETGFDIHYIGSAGIERELMENQPLTFHTVQSGKLRRYFARHGEGGHGPDVTGRPFGRAYQHAA